MTTHKLAIELRKRLTESDIKQMARQWAGQQDFRDSGVGEKVDCFCKEFMIPHEVYMVKIILGVMALYICEIENNKAGTLGR